MQEIKNSPLTEPEIDTVPLPEEILASPAEFDAAFDPEDLEPRPLRLPNPRRIAFFLCVVLGLLLAVFLPPLMNMNRFRRQTASSISASLGRPVHMESLTLNILPMPGFTLQKFVVSEDPAFGSEPVIRANTVSARLRISSLWRKRVEFSRISLDETSVNLVRRADGRWNIESILLQASKIDAAPTSQPKATATPRFPYIEATGARVNIKLGLEKMPISLTDAEFALWLPQPQQWKLRLEGHPTRTDAAPADAGLLRVQGTLGKAAAMKDVPVDLAGEWSAAPLGAVSSIITGSDAGFRGEMNLRVSVSGPLGDNVVESRLQLTGLHRADFVPARPLAVDLACRAQASAVFQRLRGLSCSWPARATGQGLVATGEVPLVAHPNGAEIAVSLVDAPASGLLDGVRMASERVAPELALDGKISGQIQCCATPAGTFTLQNARLALGNGRPFVDAAHVEGHLAGSVLTAGPVALDLGGTSAATLDGRLDTAGVSMHLSGSALRSRLLQLAAALPQFGDGLSQALPSADTSAAETPARLDLVSSRPWAGGQTWTQAPAERAPRRRRRR